MALLGLNSPFKVSIFVVYMSLWTAIRLIIYASQRSGTYNSAAVVLFIEVAKLGLSAGMYLRTDGTLQSLVSEVQTHRMTMVKYFVPAALYCVYNNLTFVVLGTVNPSTYAILQQMRIVVTALLFQRMLKRTLSNMQWVALILLTVGCMLKEAGSLGSPGEASESTPMGMYILIAVQIFCAVFAGVYNEQLLKGDQQMSLNLQNVFMYLMSIIANILFMALGLGKYTLGEAIQWDNLVPIFTINVFPVIICFSMIGIVTSMVLKHLNSVLKTIASALELFATALATWFLFGIPVDGMTFVSLVLVSTGVYVYSVYPPEKPTPAAAAAAKEGGSGADSSIPDGSDEAV